MLDRFALYDVRSGDGVCGLNIDLLKEYAFDCGGDESRNMLSMISDGMQLLSWVQRLVL